MNQRRRGFLQIMKDGLLGIEQRGHKTGMMFCGMMSYAQVQQYFPLAQTSNLIIKHGRHWYLTPRGRAFIAEVEAAEQLLGIERPLEAAE